MDEEKHVSPLPDPNSPDRQKATKLALASKVCKIFGFVSIGAVLAGTLILRDDSSVVWMFAIVLAILPVFLSGTLKYRELMLRCTKRTTARCIKTVCRHSGKSIRRYPIVEFEVDGMPYTAELSVSCSRHAEGELYTIYYDPLDPKTVRTEERTWLR